MLWLVDEIEIVGGNSQYRTEVKDLHPFIVK
jgi:hypothetical protein